MSIDKPEHPPDDDSIYFDIDDIDIRSLSPVERYTMFLEEEEKIDGLLASGRMDQETAWDCYFALLHECDVSCFRGDRPRILSKINTDRYNPFNSKHPDIIMLARLRATKNENK